MIFETAMTVVGSALLGTIGWAFVRAENLATRVSVLEAKEPGLTELINTRFDSIDKRLDRIERKQDTNGKG